MSKPYNIIIQGLDNVEGFVKQWSSVYSYANEDKYAQNITSALESKEAFIELFKWKNGTGDKIAKAKMNTVLGFWDKIEVLRDLQSNFSWDEEFNWEQFETEFSPHASSPIWKLFLLHLVNQYKFPIFDQHVYRSFKFFKDGSIKELPSSSAQVYQLYKNEYKGWFNQLYDDYDIEPKKMDESFFAYGKMLKGLKGYPIQVYS
jgi:hypothetical protein